MLLTAVTVATGITLGTKALVGLILGSMAAGATIAGTTVYIVTNNNNPEPSSTDKELENLIQEKNLRQLNRENAIYTLQKDVEDSLQHTLSETMDYTNQLQTEIPRLKNVDSTLDEEGEKLVLTSAELAKTIDEEKQTLEHISKLLLERTTQLEKVTSDFENQKEQLQQCKQELASTVSRLSTTQMELETAVNRLNDTKESLNLIMSSMQKNQSAQEHESFFQSQYNQCKEELKEVNQRMTLLKTAASKKIIEYKEIITSLSQQLENKEILPTTSSSTIKFF